MKLIYHKSWGLLCVVLLLLASPNPILLSQTPTWSVTPSDYSNTMTITAELNINCIKSTDTNDLVGIFDTAGNCRGVENVVEQGGDFYVFLTAYSNESSGETLNLKMYDASADVVYDAVETVEFVSNAILGTGSNPYDIRNNRPPTDINLNSSAIEENQPIGTVVGSFSTADEDDGETFTYSLVSGTGDDDNASFSIDGDDLKSAEVFDLETKDTYLIRVQTTDANNCSYEEAFTIIINDGNDAPTDMALSNTEVAENEAIGTFIGSLTSTDSDVGNTYTYSLVPGTGDDDNGSFSIENENLVTAEVFDFEVKSSYSIRLQTDDNNGGTFQKQFTITITDVNDVPTAMALDNNQIAENEDAGTLIANLSSIDQDAADTHTYSLVNGAGDVDNANFSILNGDELVSNESFNFEAKDSYTIRLQTDDGNGGTYQESFNIIITDANDAPTDIDLSSYDTEENAPVNTLVAAFSTTDEDSGDSFTYSLVAGLGDTDNGSFQIVNGQLFTDEVFDFETKNTYSIRIQTDDSNGGVYEEVVAIDINDTNDAPTDIALSQLTINENEPALTVLASLTTTDEDATDSHFYSLVSGDGDDDNSSFIVQDGEILTASSFNFELQSIYNIRLQTTDKGNQIYQKNFTIEVQDINDVPTALILSSLEVEENQAEGTIVGTFGTADEDLADIHTYSFVGVQPNDHNAFYILDNTLRTNEVFDYETDSSYIVYVETNDGNGGTLMETFFIKIVDGNDAPTALLMNSTTVDENQNIGTMVSTLSSTDLDQNDTFTYTLVNGVGSENNDQFSINGNQLQTAEVFNFEAKNSYLIRLRTTDSEGGFYEQAYTIHINNTNDAPTDLFLDNIYISENQPAATVVGNLSSTDEDTNDSYIYSLVSGTGSSDNASFSIVGGLLLTNESFDFETKDTYNIRIRTQDNGGGSYEEEVTIYITNANENPFELTINNTNIAENEDFASFVGIFNTIDPDIFDTHFYSFADLTPNNNGSFVIVEDQLRTFEVFDFETQNVYVVHVETNDGNGGTFIQQFVINVTDANDAPTAIALSSNTIAENLPSGSTVGFFQTTDQDAGDTFTYSLVEGFGGEDNASFQISDNELQSAKTFDLDTKDSYSILVRTEDGNGESFEQIFTILITDANDAPTDLALSTSFIKENNEVNSVVGTFATTDADAADIFTYSLVEGEGDDDNGSFSITSNQLLAMESFNFEVQNVYSIRVQSDDGNGGTIEKIFTIDIQNANDAPTDLQLDNAFIAENQPVNTLIGVFSSTDEDTGEMFTYNFDNEETNDNGSFVIVGNELRTFASFNFEAADTYNIQVKTTDSGGKTYTEPFLIEISDANDAPTDIQLSSNTIAENLSIGSKVGIFSTTDEDTNDSFSYSLAAGIGDDDNASFQISGDELQSNEVFDLDTKDTYQIRIQTNDGNGGTYQETFTINITDSNDAPTAISMSNQSIEENQPIGTIVGSFDTADTDANDEFSYTLVAGNGDSDNGSFEISGNELLSKETFNFEVKNSYSIRVQTDDGNGGTFEETFAIQILDNNDTPISLSLNNNLIAENLSPNTPIGILTTVDEDAANSFVYTFDNNLSNDNDLFSIVGNEVRTNTIFNFEANNSFNIAIQTNDGQGGTLSQQFTIQITNANDTPTDIQLSSNTIAENLSSGSKVGSFSTTDEDTNDSFTYSLVAGIGADDNASFQISGSELQSAEMFDLDVKDTYSIRIQTNDGNGGAFEETFTINITDANDAPTALSMNNQSIEENQVTGSLVGSFNTTDADVEDDFTYTLVDGDGSDDNSSFQIAGEDLLTLAKFNFEVKNSYSIRVQTDDGNGGTLEEIFTINITDINDVPTLINLNNNLIAENLSPNTPIGILTTVDEDAANSFVYTFDNNLSNDNDLFSIVGNEVRTNTIFNFEENNSFNIAIQTNDGQGGTLSQQFTIQITNANDTPTDIQLSSNTIAENLSSSSKVGSFSTTDEDANDSFTYSLVAGIGADDNGSFQISGSELQSAEMFDLDIKDTYFIRIQTNDGNGGIFEETFTINITDANDAPTALSMNNQSVEENQATGSLVGSFSTTDADVEDDFTYTLVDGDGSDDNSSFQIAGEDLLTLAKFNFEVKNSYSIRVQTDDGNGGILEETFVISIEDANDLPTLLELSNNLVSENQPQNTEIGTFATTDEDTNSTFTYTFQNEGVNDNAQFLIIGNSLRTNAHFNFEEDNVYVVNIQVNDGNGGTLDNLFVINITDANDAPTDIQLSSHTIAENLASGSKVGNFSATDEDLTDVFTYSLVAGIGDVDNGSFQITGNELQSAEMFDLDSQSSYQIRVQVTDNGGSSYEEIFSIQITDSNDTPTALSMDSQHIEENKAIASLVGSFNTVDADENDNFTYTLVSGSGDTDNSSFQIVEDELLTAATFNFEVKNSYSIRVQTDDGNGGTFEESFVIQILDSNDLPTAINMDNLLIAENQAFNTLIGELSTTDEDTNNNFTYSFDNSVSNDNTLFAIVGNQVLTNVQFNFEAKNSYHIGIQTNDGNGGTHSQQFTINITDANDAPTALQLSSSTIAENLDAGSKVGILMTTDEDANANFTYSLVEGIGSDDNSSFKIVGSELQSAEMFDLDTKASYSIRVQTNDGQGGTYQQTFTIKITDTNDAPTALTLNKQSVSENQPIETLVGTFSTEDADEADNFTYKLVTGDNDNGSFVIQNNELRTQQVFNFEVKNAYTIEVQTDDGNGGVLTMSFFIKITDANDTPTALSLDNNVVAENEEANTLVGTFTTTDEDENNEFVYTFVNEQDNDNKKFFLVGNELRTTAPFNFEEKAFYQVYVQSSDGLGGTIVRPFMVSVSNANDAPTDLQLSSNTIAENLASNSNIGFFTTSDEDANETFSYELVNGNGGQGNAAFQIIGNELVSSVSFDLDTQDSYSIRVRSADAKGGSFEKVFNILITDANDAPTALSLNNLTILENQEIGTLVGTLSTQDADNNDSFTYKLVTGQGGNDNSFFKINNGELLSATTFNYETQSQFAIRIQTNDGNGGTFEQTFNIQVVNQNDLPTAMNLSNNLVVENQAQGTIIGFFETSDEDVSDTFSYTFVAGTSYNHEAFVIVDNVLMTNYPLNFESQTLYNIQVQSNDGNGGTFTRQFTINVANANDEPTDISLSSNTIAENLPSESIVGYFNAEDEDAGTNFTYALVNGDGSTDNASFKIVGNELRSAVSFDLDTKATYTIRVQVSDGQGGTKEEIFSVQITDANDAPTALLLSNFDIIENHPIGTVIGVLSSTDADAFDSFTYKLVAGTGGNDNQFFTINDNQLVSNSVFNYEEKNSFHVRIRTDDGNGGFLDKTFVINVLNENDLPTAMQLSQSSLAENEVAGTLIGTLTTTDEDSDAAFTYTLTNNSMDNSYFLIEGNELRSKETFNFEEQAFYQIAIEVNDGNSGTLIREWVISITNENDVPKDLLLTSNTIAENLSSNTTVGLLETQDEDAGESFTYSLVTGTGSDDNAHFKILGNELKSNAVFDLDTKDNYTARIQSTDSQGANITEVFNIIITDANDAPTALTMNVQQIAENQEVGTLVAQISTQDADAFDTFTYKLVSGQGSTDNSNFKVVGDELVSNTVFNFEAKSQYQIRLETNDGNGGTFQQSFNIQVTDANDAPTALKLSNSVVAENQDVGTLVGVFTTTDEDANDIFSYKFINSSENDNAYFTLDGNVLKTSTPLDFEEQAFHTIEVQTDDGNGGTFALQFSITVTNNNDDAPTAISLTRNSVAENQVVGTLVGKLSTQDIDGNSNFTYSFAPGGANNEQFVIDGDVLLTNAVFNYEVKNSYQIRLQTDDGNEGVFQENFTIFITDENDQPTDIALSNNKVTEEQASGVTVGILSSTDEDANDSFTYTLVDEGANDNESFVIQGAVLQTNKKLDYETQPFLTVAVQTDDGRGGNFVKQLTIEVVDSNEDAPTAISITRNSVSENQVIGTLVGKFSTQDIDGGGNFVYTLATGVADNDLFAIEADALLTREVFNYEAQSSYQILVRTEDENGNSFEEGMTILITDENDAPSAISLSSNELIENQLEGALIGYFSTTDEDANDSYSYRFVDLQNNDNDLFSIVGGELRSNALFNFEAKQSYSIDIETDDNRGGTHQQSFQILIIDNNDVPTGLSLSNQSIAENQPIGTIVGMLNTIDEDASDSHIYNLVSGLGADHNDLFSIVGNELVSNAVFDLEVQAELKVRILTTDAAGTSFDTPFIITVRDENDAPTLLSLSSQTIAENQVIGTVVGTFNTTDPDGGDEHSYELIEGVGGDHNDLFSIQDNVLFSNAVFDFEVQNSYSILVKSSDGQADGIQQAFTVTILDANDAPAAIALSPASVPENEAIGTYVGTLSAMDQDAADSHQFELVNSGGGNNNDHFSIVNNELRTFKVLDFEAQPTYFIEVMADDTRGGTLTQVLSVEVTDANDAPTALVLTNQQVVENAAMGSTIGMFMTTDIDAADSHIYSLIEGMGSQDNAAFGIEGSNLVLNTALDINTKDTYSIRVAATDLGGKAISQSFQIQVIDANNSPTAILLSNLSIRENEASGTIIGSLLTEDADVDDEHTFELVTNDNAPDSDWFKIVDGQLMSAITFNYELNPSLQIAVVTTDLQGSTFEQAFTIEVVNVNESPMILSESFSIAENSDESSMIGTIEATDEDLGQTLTFALVNESDVPFKLDASTGELTLATNRLDYEEQDSYELEIEVSDNGNPVLSASKTIEVRIEDLIETTQTLPANNYLSPNNDGSNDYFEIQNVELYADFELTIFNANGEEIFHQASNYQNDWDGTFDGEILPTGVYYYLFQNPNDSEEVFKGTISIVK